jgi:hypothetical protein
VNPAECRQAALAALKLASLSLPHLSGLARLVEVYADRRVETAGITASGRLLVSPDWFGTLSVQDRTFVVAHELLHLAFRSHERGEGSGVAPFNVAHDYIINDILVDALGHRVPAGGLEWPGARHLSAEAIVTEMRRRGRSARPGWSGVSASPSPMGAALAKAGLVAPVDVTHQDDLITESLERRLFPGFDPGLARQKIREASARAVSLERLKEGMDRLEAIGQVGGRPGDDAIAVDALRTLYRPPWELALQTWMEEVAPGPRSYARPSRRTAEQADVVLAGRKREGWTLHIILDTSGSMASEFSRLLGMIASFCETVHVTRIHLLQCDSEVSADEWLEPEELDRYTILGLGGSDLSPAIQRLAEDVEVESAIVITDGAIEYPESPPPYNVLWVLTWKDSGFDPPYGRVIEVELVL